METIIEKLHHEIDQIPLSLAQELLSFLVIRRELQNISGPGPASKEADDSMLETDYLGQLLKNPIKAPGFIPFSREECHDRASFR